MADTAEPQVFFVDLLSNEVTNSVRIGKSSTMGRRASLATDPTGETLYAAVSDSPILTLVNTQDAKSEGKDLSVGVNRIIGFAASPSGGTLAVGGDQSIALVSSSGKVRTSWPFGSHTLAFSPDGERLFAVGRTGLGSTLVLDTKSGKKVDEYRVGTWPSQLLISPDGKTGYAIGQHEGIIAFETDTGKEIATYLTDGDVASMALSPDGRFIYFIEYSGTSIVAIDALTMTDIDMQPVYLEGASAGQLILSQDGGRLYLLSTYNGEVILMETGL